MKAEIRSQRSSRSEASGGHAFEKVILRLVKGGREREAIEAGEVDAILDPRSGRAILLPHAQRALFVQGGPNRRARATLDALSSCVGILDANGIVQFANKASRAFAAAHCGLAASLQQGANYLAACDDSDAAERVDGSAIAAGLRQIIAGDRGVFRYEFSSGSPAGRAWLMLTITSVEGDADARAVIACEDITERKHSEVLLAVQYRVARDLAAAQGAAAAVTTVIRTVCESLHWDCGRFFRFDPATDALRFEGSWGVATTAVEQFLANSRGVLVRPGSGLKGRVYLSGQPLWLLERRAGTGLSSTALAPETEGDAAFVIPVTSRDRTIGVLAFSNRNFRQPDDRMLETAGAVGSQLGEFLERQEALDKLRRSEARFRKTTELSSDWYWEQDSFFRFTQFVGSGITGVDHYLGKTHWDLGQIQLSETQWAEHRSHLAAHWSFCDFEFAALHPSGELGFYCISGEPVYDDAGTFLGYCGTGLDITLRKRAEIALRESEAALRLQGGTRQG